MEADGRYSTALIGLIARTGLRAYPHVIGLVLRCTRLVPVTANGLPDTSSYWADAQHVFENDHLVVWRPCVGHSTRKIEKPYLQQSK